MATNYTRSYVTRQGIPANPNLGQPDLNDAVRTGDLRAVYSPYPTSGGGAAGARGTGGTGGSSSGGGTDQRTGIDRIEAARNQILGMTQGRAQSLEGDPYYNAALGRLNQQDNLPYNDATVNRMLSEQYDMAAAAEAAQGRQLRGLAGAGDPSLEAAKRSLMSRRQIQNQASNRDIRGKAAEANFAGALQRDSLMADIRNSQNALINQMYGQAADFLARDRYAESVENGLSNQDNIYNISGLGGAPQVENPSATGTRIGDNPPGFFDFVRNPGGAPRQPQQPMVPQQPQRPPGNGGGGIPGLPVGGGGGGNVSVAGYTPQGTPILNTTARSPYPTSAPLQNARVVRTGGGSSGGYNPTASRTLYA